MNFLHVRNSTSIKNVIMNASPIILTGLKRENLIFLFPDFDVWENISFVL